MTWGIIVWIYPSVSSCFVDSRDVFRNDGLSPYRLYLPLSTCRRNIDILSVCPSNHLLMSSIEPFSKSGGSRSCTSTVGNDRINLRSSSVGEGFEGMPSGSKMVPRESVVPTALVWLQQECAQIGALVLHWMLLPPAHYGVRAIASC